MYKTTLRSDISWAGKLKISQTFWPNLRIPIDHACVLNPIAVFKKTTNQKRDHDRAGNRSFFSSFFSRISFTFRSSHLRYTFCTSNETGLLPMLQIFLSQWELTMFALFFRSFFFVALPSFRLTMDKPSRNGVATMQKRVYVSCR